MAKNRKTPDMNLPMWFDGQNINCLLYTSPEFSITEGNAWMSTLNNSVQYVSVIRPGEKVAKLVKRMHYVSFVGMFRSDLFEGLCVGHAPKKCKICGKWFLTTNARHTKYCGGYAPGDKLHRTCLLYTSRLYVNISTII